MTKTIEELEKDGWKVVHVLESPKPCEHEWPDDVQDTSQCLKCGISFIRHIFMEMP